MRRQRLLGAGVGRRDRLAVTQVVVGVDAVQEEHAGFGMVVGGVHDLVPQLARGHAAVDPLAVGTLARAGRLELGTRLGLVHELDLASVDHGLHEGIGDADRDVEVLQITFVLGVDEGLDVRVIAAQHAHLRATPCAGGFDGLAAAVEHPHVADRARGAARGAGHRRALRPDAAEVVAHPATAAHRFGGLRQRGIDAGVAVVVLRDAVAHRLHEAVDQGGAELGAGGRGDAPGGHEAALLRVEEPRLPVCAALGRLDAGQGASDPPAHVVGAGLAALGVLFDQHLGTDRLRGQGSDFGVLHGHGHRVKAKDAAGDSAGESGCPARSRVLGVFGRVGVPDPAVAGPIMPASIRGGLRGIPRPPCRPSPRSAPP